MIINLIDKTASHIHYDISKFPDGQQDIIIKGHLAPKYSDEGIHQEYSLDFGKKAVKIAARFNNFLDLEIIICTTKALREIGVKEISLYIPYLLGARSDRKFVQGGNHYLRDIIAPILNSQGYESISCIDAHSSVSQAVIPNLIVHNNEALVKFALSDINSDNFVLVAPDAGAQHKIFNLAKEITYKGEIITCTKERDLSTGKILKTSVNKLVNGDFVIIDDICDGGKTFIEIAKVFKKNYPENKIYLIVTHGIFSQGFSELYKYFTKIYCTNSYSDLNSFEFTTNGSGTIDIDEFVKRLKVI